MIWLFKGLALYALAFLAAALILLAKDFVRGLLEEAARPASPEPGDPPPLPAPCCRRCGCTDSDCSGCIARTGAPCFWIQRDLCSACEGPWNSSDGL